MITEHKGCFGVKPLHGVGCGTGHVLPTAESSDSTEKRGLERCRLRSTTRSLMFCTRSGFVIRRRARFMPLYSMRGSICALSARCIGSWPRTTKSESAGISCVILGMRHRSFWLQGLMRSGRGTSAFGSQQMTYFYLYVILDIFSRYGLWRIGNLVGPAFDRPNHKAPRHRARKAHLHADRGSSMTSKAVALLLADL